mmetsp:Transcript_24290/g.61151  ORF Transcript_24290/g.61151 Transcript_24290/m.61151 type:complete len:245 (+) Transcript_24290:438-1172(+)
MRFFIFSHALDASSGGIHGPSGLAAVPMPSCTPGPPRLPSPSLPITLPRMPPVPDAAMSLCELSDCFNVAAQQLVLASATVLIAPRLDGCALGTAIPRPAFGWLTKKAPIPRCILRGGGVQAATEAVCGPSALLCTPPSCSSRFVLLAPPCKFGPSCAPGPRFWPPKASSPRSVDCFPVNTRRMLSAAGERPPSSSVNASSARHGAWSEPSKSELISELRMCEVSATLDVPAGPAARMRSMRVP